jgi:flagellar basal-body rod modification protein FlgD
MPGIGRPDSSNSFGGITIGSPESLKKNKVAGTPERGESAGDVLNRMSNNNQDDRGVKFVDRRTHNQMGKDEFMKLLTNQLANQDPTNPVDNKKFSGEMAQYAQLEQLTNMNSKLEQMGKNAPAENKFFAASFIGREVTTNGTSVTYDGESRSVDIPFILPQNARKVTINLYDKQNQLVARVEEEGMSKGNQVVSWDGKALDQATANKGEYRVEVRAYDQNLEGFAGETKSSGLVTSVSFENGETVLQVDGKKKVFLRDVDNFRLAGQNKGVSVPAMNTAVNQYKQQGELQN